MTNGILCVCMRVREREKGERERERERGREGEREGGKERQTKAVSIVHVKKVKLAYNLLANILQISSNQHPQNVYTS